MLGGGSTGDTPITSPGDPKGEPSQIKLIEIQPNPLQPRKVFEAEGLQELRDSIRQHGVLQPIVLRKRPDGYEIIAGERRWRASGLAGLDTIPATVREDVSDEAMLELALVENVQRRDLNALEKARGYKSMLEQLSLTQDQVASKVGLKRATVANHLRLLELPEAVQEAVAQSLIGMGHARAILALGDTDAQEQMLETTVRGGLSVRAVEALVQAQNTADRAVGASKEASQGSSSTTERMPRGEESWVGELQRRIQIALGTKVSLQNQEGCKGKIVLEYYCREDLDRLLLVLAPQEEL